MDMAEELVRFYFESQAEEEFASSSNPIHQRRSIVRNREGHRQLYMLLINPIMPVNKEFVC